MDQLDLKKLSKPYNSMEEELIQSQKVTSDEESLSVLIHEVELLREQIEYWRSIDAQKTEELQGLEQELGETNQELLKALEFQHTSFVQIKELAKTLVASKKSPSQCLAELIKTIYGLSVKPEELESNVKLNTPTTPWIKPDNSTIIAESRELRKSLKVRLQALKAEFAVMKNTYNQISTETAINTAAATDQRQTNVLKHPA